MQPLLVKMLCIFMKWANFRPNPSHYASLLAKILNKNIIKKRAVQCFGGTGLYRVSGGKNAVYAPHAPAEFSSCEELYARAAIQRYEYALPGAEFAPRLSCHHVLQ
jgi:hypothetical protein